MIHLPSHGCANAAGVKWTAAQIQRGTLLCADASSGSSILRVPLRQTVSTPRNVCKLRMCAGGNQTKIILSFASSEKKIMPLILFGYD